MKSVDSGNVRSSVMKVVLVRVETAKLVWHLTESIAMHCKA